MYGPVKKLLGVYVAAMLTIFPLWFTSSGYSSIAEDKYTLFIALTAAFAVEACVLYALCAARKAQLLRESVTPAMWASLAFAAVCLLSAALSQYGQYVWTGYKRQEGFLTLAAYTAVLWAAAYAQDWKKVFLGAFGGFIAVTAVIVTLQFFGKNPLGLYPDGVGFHDRYIKYGSEFLSTIGNSDLLSAVLSLSLPLYFTAFVYSDKKLYRALCALAASCALWALLLSEVTGGTVGAACAVFLSAALFARDGRLHKAARMAAVLAVVFALYSCITYSYTDGVLSVRFAIGTAAAAGLICALALFALSFAGILSRVIRLRRAFAVQAALIIALAAAVYFAPVGTVMTEASALMHGEAADTMGSSRVSIWREALSMAAEEPVLGSGPDTYGLRSQLVFTRVTDSGEVRQTTVSAAHNEYLNLLVNVGAVGLAAYLAVILLTLYALYRKKTAAAAVITAGLLGYTIQALFGISQPVSAPVLWLLLGFAQAETRRAGKKAG